MLLTLYGKHCSPIEILLPFLIRLCHTTDNNTIILKKRENQIHYYYYLFLLVVQPFNFLAYDLKYC